MCGKPSEAAQARSSQNLFDSEERYRILTELSPDGLFVTVDDRFTYANPAAANLLAAEDVDDILGRSILELVDPSHRKLVRDRMRTVLEGKPAPLTDYRIRRLDGTHVYVEAASSPIMWTGKRAAQIIVRDITARKHAEEDLRDADRRKDEFLATLAHELRNPLAPIQTGIEVLSLENSHSRAADDVIEMMDRQVRHLVRLVDDLLDISRINRGKVALRKERVDVREAIIKALEGASSFINAGGRRVFVRYPPRPLSVNTDPVRVVQIIANLLSNAGRYTHERGTIWLSAEQEGKDVKVTVRDDGVGISPEAQRHLFQRFMQVDSNRAGGLGIGLALVRSLVELHDGSVEAHSDGLGRGSQFIVRLPLLERRAAKARKVSSPARQVVLRGKRVLIVDDNKDAANSLAMLLSLLGAEVRAAHEGAIALESFQEFAPDIVLLDLGMPEMDGYEVARRIRETPAGRHAQVVAVTGWGQEEDQRRTQKAGFDGHLVKPIEMKDLKEVLAKPPK